MARREAETENHWPGFVDVLSTIVMVVTFLLIILGVVIFVISENVAKEIAKSKQQVETAQAALEEVQEKAEEIYEKALSLAGKEEQSEQSNESSDKSREQNSKKSEQNNGSPEENSGRTEQSAAAFRVQMSKDLTQNDQIKSKDKLTVRTRKTKNTKQIVVSTIEQETHLGKLKVTSSTAALSLLFKGGVKISKEATGEIQTYLKSNEEIKKTGKFEIRAFFNTTNGSISEAKRLAYYRALSTRNELLTLGIDAKKIAIKVAVSGRNQDAGKVNIYLK